MASSRNTTRQPPDGGDARKLYRIRTPGDAHVTPRRATDRAIEAAVALVAAKLGVDVAAITRKGAAPARSC